MLLFKVFLKIDTPPKIFCKFYDVNICMTIVNLDVEIGLGKIGIA